MRVRKEIGYILLLVIGTISIVAVIGGVWLYVNLIPMIEDRKLQAEMVRLHAASRVYYAKIDTFQGVCKDMGVRPGYECNESNGSFAVSVEREDGSFYCIDTGADMVEQLLPIRDLTKCSRADDWKAQ